ncbi:MAG: 2-oxoglutarate dehydrogenase E1 component [bacterium]|nr:2-oxoglutarate dehydrogenase E1 component [bacterium]
MAKFDFAHISNAAYIEEMYERYQTDPDSLSDSWAAFFAGFELGGERGQADAPLGTDGDMGKGVHALVHAYRSMGHLIASMDPLHYKRPPQPLLEMTEYGFTDADLSRQIGKASFVGSTDGTLQDLIEKLRMTYCRSIGVEYTEIPYKSQREWLQKQMEPILNRPKFSKSACRDILEQLMAAEALEQFVHTKYIGYKRFSIEGGEALLPLLTTMVETGAALGVEEVVMGMAHRGRLNILAHLMHKPYEMIFGEFEGTPPDDDSEGSGDVKYHMGFSHDYKTRDGLKVHLALSPNPSHLELVNPVIEGIVLAKQEYLKDVQHSRVVPILIHGDASFTGQGLVPETMCLSQLDGYDTGGTIHVIVNNQIGFTAMPHQTRFTSYPSDTAKIIHAPIFHVNADDPEAVVHVAQMAMAYRQAVKADVIIDMWCYRRYGHNEADDPVFTQPLRYKEIEKHPTVGALYARYLQEHNLITEEEVAQIREDQKQRLDNALEAAKQHRVQEHMRAFGGLWKGLSRAGGDWSSDTRVGGPALVDIAKKATVIPEDFSAYPKLQRLLKARRDMVMDKIPMDWGCAEMLAFGSLLLEGVPVRLSGQDSQRGTFSHRHAVWHDVETGKEYAPLANLSPEQGPFTVLNSMLSELAVLGFEYGISSADPRRLTIWEAQFGDFSNMAQPIIDQFIASAESKWKRMSGLVMLLPHGFEGQGPEHSSARLERYLSLCAENNMQVCCATTPAQYFHLLRRQMHQNFRKPLVMMMPKSLLRHKDSTSEMADLTQRTFQPVIDDPAEPAPEGVRRIVFCTGKVFFDLKEGRETRKVDSVALVRIEQLNPFPFDEVGQVLQKYTAAEEIFWAQEEPQNMGAWDFTEPKIRKLLENKQSVVYAGRPATASTATGIQKVHLEQQKAVVDRALDF